MVLSYVLVAVVAIAGYEALRRGYNGDDAAIAGRFARAATVIAIFISALPLGALLGAVTVSALADDLLIGLLVLGSSVTVVGVVGLGLYITAEGEVPGVLHRTQRT